MSRDLLRRGPNGRRECVDIIWRGVYPRVMHDRTFELLDTWAVVFSKDSNSPIWKRICPGEYKHVSLLRYSARADTWLYIDLNFGGVDVIVGPGDTEAIEAITTAIGDADILTFPVERTAPVVIRAMFNCVQFVKHALGVRAITVLTPDQLYRHLLKNGADTWSVRRSDAAP